MDQRSAGQFSSTFYVYSGLSVSRTSTNTVSTSTFGTISTDSVLVLILSVLSLPIQIQHRVLYLTGAGFHRTRAAAAASSAALTERTKPNPHVNEFENNVFVVWDPVCSLLFPAGSLNISGHVLPCFFCMPEWVLQTLFVFCGAFAPCVSAVILWEGPLVSQVGVNLSL